MIQLILGGARSGKSRLAEQTAQDSGLAVTYIATAQALDTEMQQRIAHHQMQRPADWQLVEEPYLLAERLQQIDAANQRAVSRIHEIGERVLQQAAVSHEVADNMSNLNATIEEGTQSLRRVGDAVASLENAAHDLHRLVQHLERNLR